MLYIWLGDCYKSPEFRRFIWNQNIIDVTYKPEWFKDETVVSIIKDVDKNTEVNSALSIMSPVLGPITLNSLSGGVKTLILAKYAKIVLRGSGMGENCIRWLGQIGKETNVYLNWDWTPTMNLVSPLDFDFPVYYVNNYKVTATFKEFMRELAFTDKEEYVPGTNIAWESLTLGTSAIPAIDVNGKLHSLDYAEKADILDF